MVPVSSVAEGVVADAAVPVAAAAVAAAPRRPRSCRQTVLEEVGWIYWTKRNASVIRLRSRPCYAETMASGAREALVRAGEALSAQAKELAHRVEDKLAYHADKLSSRAVPYLEDAAGALAQVRARAVCPSRAVHALRCRSG